MTDHIQEQLRGFASPVDTSKPHNYLIVFDSEHRSHYLDRYAPGSVTLCRIGAALAEMEHDPRGYLGGVDCDFCRDILAERLLRITEPNDDR